MELSASFRAKVQHSPNFSSTWWMIYSLIITWMLICIPDLANGSPLRDSSPADTQPGNDYTTFAPWIAGAAGLCLSITLVACVCCRKPKGFAEFRSSTQLNELGSTQTPGHSGELTLFPPPSLSLDREDLDISFEPLPKPGSQALNSSYRPKEINEWIDNGKGLFPRYNIQYLREIGRGWFGQVVEAEVKDLIPGQLSTRCVVKILRPESTAAQHSKFLKDVQPLLKLDHPHVLKLYSCCLEAAPFLIILQHCPNGDLKQFLAAYSPSRGSHGMPSLPENVLLRIAWEAAEGLSHWHQAGFCHPDVAARSFLVTGDMTVVLGDYGTHTITYPEDFVDTGQQLLPVRWCSPECFQPSGEVIHTQAGNVWSFGVVLWEILTMGSRPYAALTDDQVVQQVLLEKRTILNPPGFNYQQGQSLYQLMLQCWEVVAPARPKAEVLAARLAAACSNSSRDVESDLEKAFDSRWNAAKPGPDRSSSPSGDGDRKESPSASLNNLHGSLDNLDDRSGKDVLSPSTDKSESGFSAKVSAALRSLDEALAAAEATDDDEEDNQEEEMVEDEQVEEEEPESLPEPEFRLGDSERVGPEIEDDVESNHSNGETSDLFSLTRSDWQDKIVRGELTALVREKSRSVQDLMILTHVEPMSDVEFLSLAQQQPQQDEVVQVEKEQYQSLAAPAISVTSPSNTTRSPMMESDAPLLDSTDAHGKGGLDPSGSPITRNRNRLTSTPREDTDFDAMESSFRSEQRTKPTDYAPFSPESLDATEFTDKGLKGSRISEKLASANSNTDEWCVQMNSTKSENDSVFQTAAIKSSEEPVVENPEEKSSHLAVHQQDWNHLLEESYPRPQYQARAMEELIEDPPGQLLRDSGIARQSFVSIDMLGGSTFAAVGEDTANREWMDDLSLVARMWNEELAAALALDPSGLLINEAADHHFNVSSLTDPTDASLELSVTSANTSGPNLSAASGSSPTAKSYFCYDRIDEDIPPGEHVMEDEVDDDDVEGATARKIDLSTIREEEPDCPEIILEDVEEGTGRSFLSQLQMKGRIQRHLEMLDSGSDDDDGNRDDDDDDDDVLVVDLESKRAVMVEGHSPKLKAAIASQDYGPIFGTPSKSEAELNGQDQDGSDDDDNQDVNDFEDDDDEDDEGDEGIASNFVWQACYPAKLNQSFSMEVIEEECEEEGEDDAAQAFVPSTWRADATPTRPAMRKSVSPDKSEDSASDEVSPKKNVSFSQAKWKEVYQYPVEVIEEPPARRQWTAPIGPLSVPKPTMEGFADLGDWDFSVEEGDGQHDTSNDSDDAPRIAKPTGTRKSSNLLTSSVIYRLSGVDDEEEFEGEENNGEPSVLPSREADENEDFFKGDWPAQFSQSEFQPNQFFPDWERQDETSSAKTNNGYDFVEENAKVDVHPVPPASSRSEDEGEEA